MKFCKNCKKEVSQKEMKCPDCGGKLVQILTYEDEPFEPREQMTFKKQSGVR